MGVHGLPPTSAAAAGSAATPPTTSPTSPKAGPTPAAASTAPGGVSRSSSSGDLAQRAGVPPAAEPEPAAAQPAPARSFFQNAASVAKAIWNGGIGNARVIAQNENGEFSEAQQAAAQQTLSTLNLFSSAPTTRATVDMTTLPAELASLVDRSEQIRAALQAGQTVVTSASGEAKTVVEASQSLKTAGEELRAALSNTSVFTILPQPQRRVACDALDKWSDEAGRLSDAASAHLNAKTPEDVQTDLPQAESEWPEDIRAAADTAALTSSINLDASAAFSNTMFRLLPLAVPLKIMSKIKDKITGGSNEQPEVPPAPATAAPSTS
jgi:hypothetical protein